MENKKKEYNTEYQRQKRGSTRRQERGNTLEDTVRVNINLKREMNEKLKEIAISKKIGVNQLLRDLIEEFIQK